MLLVLCLMQQVHGNVQEAWLVCAAVGVRTVCAAKTAMPTADHCQLHATGRYDTTACIHTTGRDVQWSWLQESEWS
jgi:hypothetical protein